MPELTTLVVATRNQKKGRELLALLAPLWEPPTPLSRLRLETLADYPDAPEVDEDADTFEANARKKASETAQALARWVIADDSGLAVDALDGAPGVLSARYAGTHGDDDANNRKLLATLDEIKDDSRGAAFVCAVAVADPSGAIRAEAHGQCRGQITRALHGAGGFGYDPLFLIREYHKTFGELSSLVKQQLSHRARAINKLRPALEALSRAHASGG